MDDLTMLGNNSQSFIASKEHTSLAKTLTDLESKDGHQPMKQMDLETSWFSIKIPDKGNFRPKLVRKKIKKSTTYSQSEKNHQEDIKVVNIYAINIGATNKH